ncbi:MAG: acyl-CoA dehydrogenase family protein [Chloroflexota bacterium]
MAGFGFDEAQEMLRRQVKDFAQKELAPGAQKRNATTKAPREVARRLGEMGLLAIPVPEKYGGQGSDWVSYAIALEELARVDFFASMAPIYAGVAYVLLSQTPEEKWRQWLPPVLQGERICCFAVSEPEAGSDAAAMKLTATRDGDGYILNGEKTSISVGMDADVALLFAKTNPKERAHGITTFWVPLDLPGIVRSHLPHTGYKPMAAASIIFDGVRIPAANRISEEGKGFYAAAGGMDFLRPSLGMVSLGMAEAALDAAASYALQRTAFGRPIAKFEGVSFKVAEHATRLEAARLLCYRTFYLRDLGLPHTKESAMCKWWCPVVAFDAVHDAILLHGHIGYSEEFPLEQRLRDLLGMEFADGTAQIMKIIIAREMMGRVAVPY